MKKILLVLGVVVATILLVGIGWVAGFQSKFLTKSLSVNLVDKALTDLSTTEMLLRDIQTGKIDEAKHSLQMQMNCDILTVDGLIDYSDERSRELARKIFTRIAHDRAEFPPKYTGDLPKMDPAVEARIDSILKRASESKK
jgi:hypothetical protein